MVETRAEDENQTALAKHIWMEANRGRGAGDRARRPGVPTGDCVHRVRHDHSGRRVRRDRAADRTGAACAETEERFVRELRGRRRGLHRLTMRLRIPEKLCGRGRVDICHVARIVPRLGDDSAICGGRRKHFAGRLRLLWRPLDFRLDVIVVLEMFQEIADVQEGVAIEATVHKRRLHSGKNACDPAFVKTPD